MGTSTNGARGSRWTSLAAATAIGLAAIVTVSVTAPPVGHASVVTGAATFTSSLNCTSWVPAVAPAGTTSATFTITGGGGASGDNRAGAVGGNGGRGGTVTGTVTVQGGQRIWAVVGCGGNGWDAGTAKGYSDGGDARSAAGGGGGASTAICLGTATVACGGGSVLAIAGGGGGAGNATKNPADSGTAQGGGSGGSVGTGANGSANSGSVRGGDNGTNGGGGQAGVAGTGASNAGAPGAGGTGARGNVAPSSAGGDAPPSGVAPPTSLSTQGGGGKSFAVNDRSGGGGGGGLAGGGAGGTGMALGSDWNAGSGGGAGSSWVRSTVTGASFGQGAAVAGCGASQNSRNALSATNAGAGSNDGGGHGCGGWVTVTWTYENTATIPAVSSATNTWSYSPSLTQTCGSTVRTLALPTSATQASVIANGGGGGGGGGGANSAYGGAGAIGTTATVSNYALPRTGGSLDQPNLNYQVGCGGGAGLSRDDATADASGEPGGAGGAGFGTGGEGGDTKAASDRHSTGGGGGGATAICIGSASVSCGSGVQLAIAAGGGGGGGSSNNTSGDRLSHGGMVTGASTSSLNADTGQAGVSRGGQGGGRGRRGSGGGGGGGGAGGTNASDNDNSVNGTVGTGTTSPGGGGDSRRTQSAPSAEAGKGTPARNGGDGATHPNGSTRRDGGGGGGGGFRGGGGGGSDEENGGSPAAGGGGSGSSWAISAGDSRAFANGTGGFGGAPGGYDSDGSPGSDGSVSVTLSGTAITFTAVNNQTSNVGTSIGSISPVTISFQDPSSAATCGCSWSATGLPAGLSMSTAGVVTGTPTTAGSSSVVVTVVSSGSVYTATASALTWTVNNTSPGATSTALSCSPGSVSAGNVSTCTATVTDVGASPSAPSGTVAVTSTSTTLWILGSPCTLGSPSGTSKTCSVTVVTQQAGSIPLTGAYSPSDSHSASSGGTSLTVTASTGPAMYSPQGLTTGTNASTIDIYVANCPTGGAAPKLAGASEPHYEGTLPSPTWSTLSVANFDLTSNGSWETHLPIDGEARVVDAYAMCANSAVTAPNHAAVNYSFPRIAYTITEAPAPGAPSMRAAARGSSGRGSSAEIDPEWIPFVDTVGINRDTMLVLKERADKTKTTVSTISRLYIAFFGRHGDHGGIAYWLRQLQGGASSSRIADRFAGSSEFHRAYDGTTSAQFVDRVYTNVLGRPADAGGKAYWLRKLDAGLSRAGLVWSFSNSKENVRGTAHETYVVNAFQVLTTRTPSRSEIERLASELDFGTVNYTLIEDVALTLADADWWNAEVAAGRPSVVD